MDGAPTVDLPTKMAPASMETVAALMSPMSSAFAFSSTLSVTVMLPWTFPYTTTERVWTSALMRAFSPTVSDPSEWISPSMRPSTTRSLVNLTFPLISTSELRTFLPFVTGGEATGLGADAGAA